MEISIRPKVVRPSTYASLRNGTYFTLLAGVVYRKTVNNNAIRLIDGTLFSFNDDDTVQPLKVISMIFEEV